MFMELWAGHFDAWDHKYEGGKHFFTVKHDVNLNFSFFTKEYVSSLLQSMLGTKVDFEAMTPNSVTFSFEDALNYSRNSDSKSTINRSNIKLDEILQKKAV
jgi:hypothetical protein